MESGGEVQLHVQDVQLNSDVVLENTDFMSAPNLYKLAALPPNIKRRIKALKKLQLQATDLEAKFYIEVHLLECKYREEMNPIYEKRELIISGGHEPTDEECAVPPEITDALDSDITVAMTKMTVENPLSLPPCPYSDAVSGIPEFWLTVFKNASMISEMIEDHDIPALRHLVDVKVNFLTASPMGFDLLFHFSPNEFFSNEVLTKRYEMKCVPDQTDPFSFDGPEIFKCEGCKIDWFENKNLTIKLVNKKQKHKTTGETRTVSESTPNESFFLFFSPPHLPDDPNEIDDEIQESLTSDFEVGHYIKERVVPRAVLYFTGEALLHEGEVDDEITTDDDDDDDDDEDADVVDAEEEPNVISNEAN